MPLTYWVTVALLTINGTLITDVLGPSLEVSLCLGGAVLFWATDGDFVRSVLDCARALDPHDRHIAPTISSHPSCSKLRLSVVG